MTTAFDLIMHDKALQDYWAKRFVATIIDVVIVLAPVYIIMILLGWMHGIPWYTGGVVSGFVWFLYSAFFEYAAGVTVGKSLLGFKVLSTTGRLELSQTMERNITKVFFLFLLVDLILAFLIETTDPHQRYMDKLAKTVLSVERSV